MDIQSRRFVGADRVGPPTGGDTMLPSTGEDVNLFQARVSDIHVGDGALASVNAGPVAANCGGRKAKPR